jgi:hypothetical protein
MRTGRTLSGDEERGEISGDEAVNALLLRPYCQPWAHPFTPA